MAKKASTQTPKSEARRSSKRPAYHEARAAKNKNSTETRPILDNTAEAMEAANAHVHEFFNVASQRFEASQAYGFQHYNQDGFLHADGVHRLSNLSLAMMALQIGEVLSQRSAQKGNKSFAEMMGEGGDPAAAQKAIDMIRKFLAERPALVKADSKKALYGAVLSDLGIADASEIVPAKGSAKTPAAKKAAKQEEETAATS